MNSLLLKNYAQISRITAFTLVASCLLVLRIKITHDFYLLFLVWNLILAFIPYGISCYLKSKEYHNVWSKLSFVGLFVVWLLFLPNAPYIITDLIHIGNSSSNWHVYDAMLIGSFAVLGTYLGMISIYDVSHSIYRMLSGNCRKRLRLLPYVFIVLSAFGIYLGRELRYNSWDLIKNPQVLWDDCWTLILKPQDHLEAWLFISSMTLFLSACYYVYNSYKTQTYEN